MYFAKRSIMKYTCIGCDKEFSRKGHYVQHLNNKTPCVSSQDLIISIQIKMQQSIESLSNKIKKQDNINKEQEKKSENKIKKSRNKTIR